MRLCRFDENRLGLVEGPYVRDVTGVLERLPVHRWPVPPGDALLTHLDGLRPDFAHAAATAPAVDLARVRLRSPVANPGKIVAVRGNYRSTGVPSAAATSGTPELFIKAPSSVVGPAEGIELRCPERRVDHEIELVAIIGRRVPVGPIADPLTAVAGYCIGLDVTLRGPEDRGLRKSLDGFTVLGPWLVTREEIGSERSLGLDLSINGATRQRGSTSDMLCGVSMLVAAAARYFTLHPGDVIMTGTPAGVGPLARGDAVCCTIDGIGVMTLQVR